MAKKYYCHNWLPGMLSFEYNSVIMSFILNQSVSNQFDIVKLYFTNKHNEFYHNTFLYLRCGLLFQSHKCTCAMALT